MENNPREMEKEYQQAYSQAKAEIKAENYPGSKVLLEKCNKLAESMNDNAKRLKSLLRICFIEMCFGDPNYSQIYSNIANELVDEEIQSSIKSEYLCKQKIKILFILIELNMIANHAKKSKDHLNEIIEVISKEEYIENKFIMIETILKMFFKIGLIKLNKKKPTFEEINDIKKQLHIIPTPTLISKITKLYKSIFVNKLLIDWIKDFNKRVIKFTLKEYNVKTLIDILDNSIENLIIHKSTEKYKAGCSTEVARLKPINFNNINGKAINSEKIWDEFCIRTDSLREIFNQISNIQQFFINGYKIKPEPVKSNTFPSRTNIKNKPKFETTLIRNNQHLDELKLLNPEVPIQKKNSNDQAEFRLSIFSPPKKFKNLGLIKNFVGSKTGSVSKKTEILKLNYEGFSSNQVVGFNIQEKLENENSNSFRGSERKEDDITKLNNFERKKLRFVSTKEKDIRIPLHSPRIIKENISKKLNINEFLLKSLPEYDKIMNVIGDISNHFERKCFSLNQPNLVKIFSVKSKIGKKNDGNNVNQDSYFTVENLFQIKNFYYFGVCDGHGVNGHNVSNYVKNALPLNLQILEISNLLNVKKNHLNQPNNSFKGSYSSNAVIQLENINQNYLNTIIEKNYDKLCFVKKNNAQIYSLLRDTIQKTHEDLIEKNFVDVSKSGTTICSIIILGNRIYCSNVGDSRAIVGKLELSKWKPVQISTDHKPNIEEEKQRIINNGGRVNEEKDYDGNSLGIFRVYLKDSNSPGIAMSRSVGDLVAHKAGVIYEPDIFEYEIKEQDKFIVIASDGVWEFMDNSEVVDLVSRHYQSGNAEQATEELIKLSREKWEQNEEIIDDITAIVIFLNSCNMR